MINKLKEKQRKCDVCQKRVRNPVKFSKELKELASSLDIPITWVLYCEHFSRDEIQKIKKQIAEACEAEEGVSEADSPIFLFINETRPRPHTKFGVGAR